MSRVIIIYACPVLNQIRACHYAYVRFSVLERSIHADIDILYILLHACAYPVFFVGVHLHKSNNLFGVRLIIHNLHEHMLCSKKVRIYMIRKKIEICASGTEHVRYCKLVYLITY